MFRRPVSNIVHWYGPLLSAWLAHLIALLLAHSFGPEEIDGLLVPPGKASTLLTDHLITG